MPTDTPIPDATPDDSYSDGDDQVDWSQVETVAEQIDEINAITDDAERLEAAKAWAARLAG